MPRKNIHGGGAQTNINGLRFERETDLEKQLSQFGYLSEQPVGSGKYYFKEKLVAQITSKNSFYKQFLNLKGVDEKKILSKKLLPDTAIINFATKRIFIIEKKYQEGAGSVDEKLQTCDFKLKTYKRLIVSIKFDLVFYFVLNDWFRQESYKDTLAYIKTVQCNYFFNQIPLANLELDFRTLAMRHHAC